MPVPGTPNDFQGFAGLSLLESIQATPAIRALTELAVRAIDERLEVGGGEPGLITVSPAILRAGNLGNTAVNPLGARISIDLNQSPSQHVTTLLHELGHAMDGLLIGNRGVSWESNIAAAIGVGPLSKWFQAVKSSRGYAQLAGASDDLTVPPDIRRYLRDYLLTGYELWARSFTQYVAEEAESSVVMESWNETLREVADPKYASCEVHWNADDFAPIRLAMDEAFESLNWICQIIWRN